MKTISLYSGGGGIDEGVKQAGFTTTLAIDIDKDCCKTVHANSPTTEVICGKVSDFKNSIGKADIIFGGPPCQDFSNANTKRKFNLTEVNLFWEIIETVKPKYFLMENVPALFIKFKKRSSKLLNVANYGVPQTRHRRFWTNLSIPKATHAKKPSDDLFGNKIKKWVLVKEALNLDGIIIDGKQSGRDKGGRDFGLRKYSTDRPSHTLLVDSMEWFISPTGFKAKNQKLISRSIDEPSQTIVVGNEMQFTNHKIYSMKYLKEKNPIMFEKHKANNQDSPAFTIDTKDRGITPSGMITDGLNARKLTNEELAILQGFPKGYIFYGTKTSTRKQIGNAVPPPIIKAFFKQISET